MVFLDYEIYFIENFTAIPSNTIFHFVHHINSVCLATKMVAASDTIHCSEDFGEGLFQNFDRLTERGGNFDRGGRKKRAIV